MHAGQIRLLSVLRILLTVTVWVILIVFAHGLAHAYEKELADALASPYAKLAAVTAFLTTLTYCVSLSLPSLPTMGLRAVALTFLWVSLIVFGHSVSHDGFHEIETGLIGMRGEMGLAGFALLTAVYALALAMPFVPGVEIGLMIIALLGPLGALVAYLATVGGLSLAYAAGRWMPEERIRACFLELGVSLGDEGLYSTMRSRVKEKSGEPRWHRKFFAALVNHRHASLGVALNFPGNSVVGGGGGLALLCGMSRQFSGFGFVSTVAVATSPLPLLVLAGAIDTQPLLEHHGTLHGLLRDIEGVISH